MPLGCSRHTAAVYDRGGLTRVGTLDLMTSVSYNRVRDDMAAATLHITAQTPECHALLEAIEPNRHEIVLFRDGERVWEGPISWIEYSTDEVTIEAKDITYYLYRLTMKQAYDNSAITPTEGRKVRNLLTNPSFQTDVTTAMVSNQAVTRVVFSAELPDASDTAILQAVSGSTPSTNTYVYQVVNSTTVAANVGKWLATSLLVRGMSPSAGYQAVSIEFRTAADVTITGATVASPPTRTDNTTGVRIAVAGVIPAGAQIIRVILRTYSDAAGAAPGGNQRTLTDSWMLAVGDDQADALGNVSKFFDGNTSDSTQYRYDWAGTSNLSATDRTELVWDAVHKRLARIIKTEIARREAESPPVNVLPYAIAYTGGSDTETRRTTPQRFSTVFEELDHMAQYAGLDYTVIGRRLILSDVHTVFHTTPEMTEADFSGPVIVTAYGMQHATHATSTDGEGIYGEAGGPDPYYGSWEILQTSQKEEEGEVAEGETPPDPPDAATLTKQAIAMLNGTNPVPFIVRLPEGSSVNPKGQMTFEHLVPGARVPLRATMTARKFSMMQKLDSVSVSDDESGEQITVSMGQASDLDVPMTGVYNLKDVT